MGASHDPDHGHHYSRTPPEQQLVVAILSRAIQDLFGSLGSAVSSEAASVVRRDALNFWTATTGDVAKDREQLCSAVGFDGGAMRTRVIAILEGDDRPIAAYGGYAQLNYVEEARALWAKSKQKPPVAKARTKPAPVIRTPPKSTSKPKPAPAMLTPEEEEAKRRELRAVIMQLLEQGPLTKRQLFAAVGTAGKSSAVAAHLYHAQRQGQVESNGDFWSLKPDRAARPQLLVAEVPLSHR